MFTMKFEIDARSADGGKTHQVFAVRSYRVKEIAGNVSIAMTFADGAIDILSVSPNISDYQRCYVMNEQGNTVHTIRPPAQANGAVIEVDTRGKRLGEIGGANLG